MDSLTTAELMQIGLAYGLSMDNQFQYWLAITFATLVAAFVTQERLSRKLALVLSGLYILASVLFVARMSIDAQNYLIYMEAADLRGVQRYTSITPAVGAIRFIILILGTGVSLWFLNNRVGRGSG
jgi:hypothetical protein